MKRLARHSLGAKAFGKYSAIKKKCTCYQLSFFGYCETSALSIPFAVGFRLCALAGRGGGAAPGRLGVERKAWSVHLLSSPLSAQCCGVIHCEASPLSQEAGPQRHCSSCGLLITATLPVIRLPWTECRNGEQSRGNLRAFSQGKFMSVRSDNTKTRLVPRASFLLYFSSYLFSHS